jgi:hypothetical protein
VQLLFLYRELEFHYRLEEAKYLEVSNQFFWDRKITVQLLFLYRELEFHYSLEEAKYLEVSNQFFWDNWSRFCMSADIRERKVAKNHKVVSLLTSEQQKVCKFCDHELGTLLAKFLSFC